MVGYEETGRHEHVVLVDHDPRRPRQLPAARYVAGH
jgi:hypothetical protein